MENELHELYESSSESENTNGISEDLLNSSPSAISTSENEEEHVKIEHFMEVIENYTNKEFRKHFRLNRSTAHILIERYSVSPLNNGRKDGFFKVGAAKEIYMLLWYMANTNTFKGLGNRFNMASSSAWRVISRTIEWLLSIGHEYIKWPSLSKARDNMGKFEKMANIPNVIGCIACTHIKIKAPMINKAAYLNRKRFYSLQLQAVVDADKMFIKVFAGEPGSLPTCRILRRSSLYQEALIDMPSIFPFNSYLLGDSTYPNTQWLISPFRDNEYLTAARLQFNFLHSSTRIIAENAFGLMKTRFRRLLRLTENSDLKFITKVIICACILHNICCLEDDSIEDEIFIKYEGPINNAVPQENENSSENRRNIILRDLINSNFINLS